VIGDDAGELETPCEEDPAIELLDITPGLETTCEEVPAFELLAGPLVVEDAGGTTTLEKEALIDMLESDEGGLITMLESDEGGLTTMLEPDERLITMPVELVAALLVVST
jgi:hypothetical protein